MNRVVKYGALIAFALSAGCRPAAPGADGKKSLAPLKPSQPIELPLRLSDSYVRSLDAVPALTAQRFFTAYENLAAYGPVTKEKILDHARFHAALERGQFLSYIFAYDLNGDMDITRSEFDALARLPIGSNHALGEAPLFKGDENGDDVISLTEAVRYSRALYAQRSKRALRPIESYLMLFDLNVDGVITRTEMKVSLKPYLRREDAERGGGDGALE